MEKRIAKDFEAKSLAMAGELEGFIGAGKYREMAGMMTGNTVLILLKSRKVFRGPEAIVDYWKKMRAGGLAGIKLDLERNVLMPIDILMSEPGRGREYVPFDLANYFFGTYELLFKSKEPEIGPIIFVPWHINGCPRKVMLMVFA